MHTDGAMSNESNDRMLISITAGNIGNGNMYLKPKAGFFPRECYGQSNRKNGVGHTLTVDIAGFARPVEVDLAPRGANDSLRCFFRPQKWLRQFFSQQGVREGDKVAVERTGKFAYRIHAVKDAPQTPPAPRSKPEARSRAGVPSRPGSICPTGVKPYFVARNPGFVLYQGDCLDLMCRFRDECVDMIFADPPYCLSNDGITCHAGKMVSVNKGKWDRSRGFHGNYEFTKKWLSACQRLLKPNATIWISGTSHIIHIVGCVLDELGYKILNDITWQKKNPPPNLSCRYFTHATETIIWAGRDKKCRHKFNYSLMKRLNGGKQMKSVWIMDPPRRDEKVFGKHPTQKPLELLERIIAASTGEGDVVLDPFSGSATTGIAAARMNRRSIGLESEQDYLELSKKRYALEYVERGQSPLLAFERDTKEQSRNRTAEKQTYPGALFAEKR